MPKPPAAPDLISTVEAAEIFGVTPRTIARYVLEGRLTPAMPKQGRTSAYVFDRAHILAERAAISEETA